MSSWHISPELAGAYAGLRLDEPQSWSLEAHIEQCSACARTVSAAADPGVLARVRGQVVDRARPPARGFVRLTVTPTLSAAWLGAVAGVVGGVLALDLLDATRLPALLLIAPLLPLLGLAVGCVPAADFSAELMASTPVSTLHVLLIRAGAVLVVSVPPLLLVSLGTGTGTLRWLAPSAGLVALALALSTRIRVEAATGCAAAVWAVATLGPAALQVPAPVGLQPGSTLGWLALAGASLVLLAWRREHLDRVPSSRGAQR